MGVKIVLSRDRRILILRVSDRKPSDLHYEVNLNKDLCIKY